MATTLDEDFETDLAYAVNAAICEAHDAGKASESRALTAYVLSRKEVRAVLMGADSVALRAALVGARNSLSRAGFVGPGDHGPGDDEINEIDAALGRAHQQSALPEPPPPATPAHLVRRFFALYTSELREIGEWLAVPRERPDESSVDYVKRLIAAAKDADKLEELARRTDAYHAARPR